MQNYYSLVARTRNHFDVFNQYKLNAWFWAQLKSTEDASATFKTVGALLMPNHLHWMVRTADQNSVHKKLTTLLIRTSIKFGLLDSSWSKNKDYFLNYIYQDETIAVTRPTLNIPTLFNINKINCFFSVVKRWQLTERCSIF